MVRHLVNNEWSFVSVSTTYANTTNEKPPNQNIAGCFASNFFLYKNPSALVLKRSSKALMLPVFRLTANLLNIHVFVCYKKLCDSSITKRFLQKKWRIYFLVQIIRNFCFHILLMKTKRQYTLYFVAVVFLTFEKEFWPFKGFGPFAPKSATTHDPNLNVMVYIILKEKKTWFLHEQLFSYKVLKNYVKNKQRNVKRNLTIGHGSFRYKTCWFYYTPTVPKFLIPYIF